MLHKIELECQAPYDTKPRFDWCALLHGILMKRVSPETADFLHSDAQRPFSQHVELLDNNRFCWHIRCWDDRIADAFLMALHSLDTLPLYFTDQRIDVDICGIKTAAQRAEVMGELAGANEMPREHTLRFKTPTTHKSEGKFTVFPSIALIYHSLLKRLPDVLRQQLPLAEIATQQLCAQTRILHYVLSSEAYMLKHIRILGYVGSVCLEVSGTRAMLRTANLILSAAEYMGIGTKTTMGMGGCSITPIKRNQKIT